MQVICFITGTFLWLIGI